MNAKKKSGKRAKKPDKQSGKGIWPPFGGQEESGAGERRLPQWIYIEPDPVPFTHVRYINAGPEPTLVSVVLTQEDPPANGTTVIPPQPGLVPTQPPENVKEVEPNPPLQNVNHVFGTVMYERHGEIRSHPFDGGIAPNIVSAEIVTGPDLQTHVHYEF